ncbi:DUF418 domain-containing protein [Microbacterium karelineae]|uniref:DUF418 domain-containing protein n=1 Tax=Microbacterium karelineae TaxID=2654283 RepID=UPI0012E9B068|nr:DUF418 domain-containing protein [Microbacterium karelineae]
MSSTIARGPVRATERSISPDLARGFALLFIALANTPFYLWGAEGSSMTSAHPGDGSLLDQIVQAVTIVAIDGRTYPLFAFLFGYGIVQLHCRQIAAGADERAARGLLQRRNAWLLVFGLVHAVLLWEGDVLGAYGLAGLIFVWLFLRRRDRTLLVWAWILLGLLALGALISIPAAWALSMISLDPSTIAGPDLHAAQAQPDYLLSIGERAAFWPAIVVGQGVIGLVVPIMILVAFWAARRGILEDPGAHLGLLRRTAFIGIAVGWLGGVPSLLVHLDVVALPLHASWMFAGLSAVTGAFAGLGYAALFGLIGAAIERRRAAAPAPRRLGLTGAIAAVGKRSLSSYLMQSVLCAPVLAGWGLGLGGVMGSTEMALYAIGVWAVTLLLAAVWEARGWRGPAEILLRRLVYRGAR